MSYSSPYECFVVDSCEGNPELISRLLLDIFDRCPPPAGTWAVIYLIFSPADEHRLWLSSVSAASSVCSHIQETYWRETDLLKTYALDRSPNFAWHFELYPTAKANVLELRYSSAAPATVVEIIFRAFADGIEPGTLHVVPRSQPVLEDSAKLLAVIEAASPPARVAPHVDRFQRGVRFGRPVLYLTERWNQFTVGPHPACDLVCESAPRVWAVRFQPEAEVWEVVTNGHQAEREAERRYYHDLLLCDETAGLCVRGSALSPPVTFSAQMDENRVPIYDLTIVSRLLPRGPARGYGYVADELRRSVGGGVDSCVRLSADGAFLYTDDYERVFVIDYGGAPPRPLQSGDRVAFGNSPTTWQAFADGSGGELASHFLGQLIFENPVTRRLASRGINVPLREAFTTHYDELQGRAMLVSRDGLDFRLHFSEGASDAPVWSRIGGNNNFQLHAEGEARWRLENTPVDFVVGSTCFRLTHEVAAD